MNAPFGIPGRGPVHRFERLEAQGRLALPRGYIDGLTLSNDAGDVTNDIGIAAGVARSTVNIVNGEASTKARDQIDLELPVSIIKQLDVAFGPDNYDPEGLVSAGNASGGRSSSAISDTSWHAILAGGNGLPADVFFHDSITQTNIINEMLKIGGYSAYRRIGSFVRATSIKLFTQTGDYFRFKTPTVDLSTTSLSTSSTSFALASIPVGLSLLVKMNVVIDHASVDAEVYIRNPSDTDTAPAETTAPLATISSSAAPSAGAAQVEAWTNTAAEIAAYSTNASTILRAAPLGYWDFRGRNS